MDKTDTKILALLGANARMTASDISREVGLSVPAVGDRIRRLEEQKVIQGYTLRLNRAAVGFPVLCFVKVALTRSASIPLFQREVCKFAEVLECHYIAQEYDYLLKVSTADMNALSEFLSYRLKALDGVDKVSTTVAIKTIKEEFNR